MYDDRDSNILYAVGDQNEETSYDHDWHNVRIFRSLDNGKTWKKIATGENYKKTGDYSSAVFLNGQIYIYNNNDIISYRPDFVPSGIQSVSYDSKDVNKTPVYDLQGRVYFQPQSGVYIINGKKFIKR